MTQDFRARADSTSATKLRDHEPSGNASANFTEPPKLTEVAQTLAAHGGGALSLDLALDLVLNDVVEQARTLTGATGAAVALFRDGQLTCRATSGENAPDLGVRVEGNSGLAGACVSSGEIQHCPDTETDARVNAEACHRLGVRSMLIAPLVDGQRLIGVIQVFSAWPNAFGKREISALQVLAGRITESNREAEAGIVPPPPPEAPAGSAEVQLEPVQPEPIPMEQADERGVEVSSPAPKRFDLWGTVLVILVIAAALALGLVIGWRRAAEFTKHPAPVKTIPSADTLPNSAPIPSDSQNAVVAGSSAAPSESVKAAISKAPATGSLPPPGGLIVTQNGKVVYRSPAAAGRPAADRSAERSLIHKVEPQYPEEARARHIQGPVVLDVEVLSDGVVGTIAVVSGDPALTKSAIDAVKQWRYEPASANEQGIESQTRVTVKFTLPNS